MVFSALRKATLNTSSAGTLAQLTLSSTTHNIRASTARLVLVTRPLLARATMSKQASEADELQDGEKVAWKFGAGKAVGHVDHKLTEPTKVRCHYLGYRLGEAPLTLVLHVSFRWHFSSYRFWNFDCMQKTMQTKCVRQPRLQKGLQRALLPDQRQRCSLPMTTTMTAETSDFN